MRALLAALAGLVVLLLSATPAQAHSQLVWSSPGDGQAFGSTSPDKVQLAFTEKVQGRLSTVRVLGPDGADLRTGPVQHPENDETTLEVGLPDHLATGAFTVVWRIVSADGHPVDGAFGFRVGEATGSVASDSGPTPLPAAVLAAEHQHHRLVDGLFTATRGVGFAGLALLVGPAAFVVLCWPGGRRSAGVRGLAWTGWWVSVASALATLVLNGPHGAGRSLSGALDGDLLTATLHSRTGTALLLRLALLAVAAPLLLALLRPGPDRARSRPRVALTIALAGALAVTWSAIGHGGVGSDVAVALPADAVHLVSMAVWTGGLAALLVALWKHDRDPGLQQAVTAFSPVAVLCVVALMTTGSYQTWRQVRTLPALGDTGYGRLLVLKVAAVGVLVLLGALARAWVRRQAPAPGGRPSRRPTDRTRLRRSVLLEAGVAVLVLGLTAVLVGLEPARLAEARTEARSASTVSTPPPVPAAPAPLPFDTGSPGGKGFMVIEVQPALVGLVGVHLTVVDPSGRPLAVPQAGLSFSLPSRDIAGLRVRLSAAGPGHYAGEVRLPAAGQWQVDAAVRTTAVDQAAVRTVVEVR